VSNISRPGSERAAALRPCPRTRLYCFPAGRPGVWKSGLDFLAVRGFMRRALITAQSAGCRWFFSRPSVAISSVPTRRTPSFSILVSRRVFSSPLRYSYSPRPSAFHDLRRLLNNSSTVEWLRNRSAFATTRRSAPVSGL